MVFNAQWKEEDIQSILKCLAVKVQICVAEKCQRDIYKSIYIKIIANLP